MNDLEKLIELLHDDWQFTLDCFKGNNVCRVTGPGARYRTASENIMEAVGLMVETIQNRERK